MMSQQESFGESTVVEAKIRFFFVYTVTFMKNSFFQNLSSLCDIRSQYIILPGINYIKFIKKARSIDP